MSKLQSAYRNFVNKFSSSLSSYEVEDKYWAIALSEFDSDSRNKDLWAKCLTKSKFNELDAKADYVKTRARQLSEDANMSKDSYSLLNFSFQFSVNARKYIFFALVLAFMIFVVVALVEHNSSNHYSENIKPKVINELNGVSLGDSIEDVLFKNKGFEKLDDSSNIPSVQTYKNDVLRLRVVIRDGRVESVTYWCNTSYYENNVNHVNGIYCGNSSEEIQKKFVNQVRVMCMTDDAYKVQWRTYDVSKYGVRYMLSYNKVEAFVIAKPDDMTANVSSSLKPCSTFKLDDYSMPK